MVTVVVFSIQTGKHYKYETFRANNKLFFRHTSFIHPQYAHVLSVPMDQTLESIQHNKTQDSVDVLRNEHFKGENRLQKKKNMYT